MYQKEKRWEPGTRVHASFSGSIDCNGTVVGSEEDGEYTVFLDEPAPMIGTRSEKWGDGTDWRYIRFADVYLEFVAAPVEFHSIGDVEKYLTTTNEESK